MFFVLKYSTIQLYYEVLFEEIQYVYINCWVYTPQLSIFIERLITFIGILIPIAILKYSLSLIHSSLLTSLQQKGFHKGIKHAIIK